MISTFFIVDVVWEGWTLGSGKMESNFLSEGFNHQKIVVFGYPFIVCLSIREFFLFPVSIHFYGLAKSFILTKTFSEFLSFLGIAEFFLFTVSIDFNGFTKSLILTKTFSEFLSFLGIAEFFLLSIAIHFDCLTNGFIFTKTLSEFIFSISLGVFESL